mgnify:CR=1 FL=1|jgi:hypothetical protein
MASIGQKLETKGVIMTLLSLVLISTGCEDKIDSPAVNPSEGKTVEVTLNLGIADEEDGVGATASPTSKASSNSSKAAFEILPVFDVQTKSVADIPDKLYNLEVWQYSGENQIGGKALGNVTVGSTITASLTQATNCKLLLVARGASADFESLSGKTLSAVQELKVKAKDSNINAIATNATGSDLSNMTYYLLLEDVNITSDGKIESPEGKDVRLLLKRLAVKVRLDWVLAQEMTGKDYILKEVKLCQVPAHYRLIPQTESTDKWGNVYPSSVAEFVDVYRLTGTELDNAYGTKTVWIPANARGISSYSNSPYYRNKTNANPAATYAEFVVDNSVKKERLYYRVYLGGNETDDFNLLENTNYHWTVNINKADYANDPRIQLLDQTPVISTNEQPTSNCFMMLPGTNICFNPYKHEAGTDGWNTYLTTGTMPSSDKKIATVEVLWQNKDAGTSGDLVLGYAISNDTDNRNHSNLVNFVDDVNIEKVRVHVKVPVTNGGNAVLAAKNNSGTILWSWHLWITDYVPVRLNISTISDDVSRQAAITAAQKATKRGTVQTYQGSAWTQSTGFFYKKVIMDRNLGALRNTYSMTSTLEAVRAYGNLYQWGRKDPIPGSVDGSNKEIDAIFDGNGVSFSIDKNGGGNLDNTIKYPTTFYTSMRLADNSWGPETKTIYDPCLDGWRVPDFTSDVTKNIFQGFSNGTNGNFKYLIANEWKDSEIASNTITGNTFAISNGFYYNESVWFPSFRMREMNGNLRNPWGSDGSFSAPHLPSYAAYGARASGNNGWYIEFKVTSTTNIISIPSATVSDKGYGFSVRCVQDN